MNLLKHKKELEIKGITVIPDVFTKQEMDRLKDEAYSITPEMVKEGGYPHQPFQYSGGHPALVFFPALANEYVNSIRKDKRYTDIVRYFCGDNVKQVNNQIYFREAGDNDQFAWHQDIVFREPRHRFPNIEYTYLQTILCVDDMTEDNGGIEFIEGSHLDGEKEITSSSAVTKMLRTFKRMGLKGKKYTASSGSLVLWGCLTVHGSEANISKSSRMTYMNGYAPAENCLDYPWAIKDGVAMDIESNKIP